MDIKRLSRKLSWLLRHGAPEAGVSMDAAGWVAVPDVLAALSMTDGQLRSCVEKNNKARLELKRGRIRACQGHSSLMPVEREALEASWVPFGGERCWHGTRVDAAEAIASEGIHAGERTHVHLAPRRQSTVGKRAQVAVLLEVDVARMKAAGLGVFRASNGVVLARRVPPEAIVSVTAETKKGNAALSALRARFPALVDSP